MPSPLVKSHLPICSVNRAIELGFDLNEVATCAVPGKLSDGTKVKGCPMRDSCRFDRKEYGGFRTGSQHDRPHFIGYYIHTIDGGAKQDVCACHTFVQGIQSRMDQGLAMKQQGAKNYEVISIVAQEGEMIDRKKTIPTPGKDGKSKWVTTTTREAVPVFPDPTANDPTIEYERDLIARMEGGQMTEAAAPSGRPLAEQVRK